MTETSQQRALRRTAPLHDGELFPDHVKLPKAASLVAHKLRRQIIRGELGEEDVLPSEAVLAERFNVSRPTLREALRVLEAENLVSIRRGAHGGAQVLMPDGEVAARHVGFLLEYRGATLRDVYLARETIEASAVRMLAERCDKADIEALRARHAEIEELSLPRPMRFAHNSLTFHQLLVELSGNETLSVFDGVINRIVLRAYESVTRNLMAKGSIPSRNAASHGDHGELIELVAAGEADAAERQWREHCRNAAKEPFNGDADKSVLDLLDE